MAAVTVQNVPPASALLPGPMTMKKNSFALLGTCLVASALLVACKPHAPEATTPAPAVAAEPAPALTPAPGAETTPPSDVVVGADYPVARDACLAAVAEKTGVAQDKLVATEVRWAEAGVGVTVQVPDSDAPWSCLSDEKGNVQGAASTGS